jgi:hypothetical protein|tara:strand:+ start:411 stop:1142 length:732 start_codon:yes stop_codon:yes gene_type:complete
MEYKLKNHFKQKLLSILEKERLEENIDDIVDNIWMDIEYYALIISQQQYYDHLARKRLSRIEGKLDTILESNSRGKCQFSKGDDESILHLITGVGLDERNKAIKHLSEKLKGAKSLTICDPYFLKKYKGASPSETAIEFVGILPKSLKTLDLYVKPRIRDKEFADCLNSELQKTGIKLLSRKTEEIHDRVWIKDFNDAFVVGTSFNGLGNKCAFILDLPQEDQRQFLTSLNEISRDLPKSKSA